jgi:putative transposase
LWEGRYRSCLIQGERYLYTCHCYIELNPVRAKLVDHPANYPWSSYRANGHGTSNDIVKPHPLYKVLGRDIVERKIAYRKLFRPELSTDVIDEIRKSTNGNFVLGDKRFADHIEARLGRRATPGRSGRPKRN